MNDSDKVAWAKKGCCSREIASRIMIIIISEGLMNVKWDTSIKGIYCGFTRDGVNRKNQLLSLVLRDGPISNH